MHNSPHAYVLAEKMTGVVRSVAIFTKQNFVFFLAFPLPFDHIICFGERRTHAHLHVLCHASPGHISVCNTHAHAYICTKYFASMKYYAFGSYYLFFVFLLQEVLLYVYLSGTLVGRQANRQTNMLHIFVNGFSLSLFLDRFMNEPSK